MTSDSYTTVDRNILLRRIEVLRSALEEFKRVTFGEWQDEFRKWHSKPWNIWTIIWSTKKERALKKFTEEDINDMDIMHKAYYVLNSSIYDYALWAYQFSGQKETMQLYEQLILKAETPTILLSTSHCVALRELEKELKESNWIE